MVSFLHHHTAKEEDLASLGLRILIKKMQVKIEKMSSEYAKKTLSRPRQAQEFTQLQNMSNRMEQIEKRVSTMKHQNDELRESIRDMMIFEKQYKKLEKKFRSRIEQTTGEVQTHLNPATATYEEREEFVNRGKDCQERCAQDLRKAEINQNALNLVLAKTKKYEDFANLQSEERFDSRIAVTEDLIEEGRTGLEPLLEEADELHSDIVSAAGKDTPDDIEDQFNLDDEETKSKFSYLEELLKEIDHTQKKVEELRLKNKELFNSLSTNQKRLLWEIEESRRAAIVSAEDAEAAVQLRDQARDELDALETKIQSLYQRCCQGKNTSGSLEKPLDGDIEEPAEKGKEQPPQPADPTAGNIDDSNVIDFIENIEKKILDSVMFIEYLQMKETADEEPTPSMPDADESESESSESMVFRSLKDDNDWKADSLLNEATDFLSLSDLKDAALETNEESEADPSTSSESSVCYEE